MQLTKWVHEPIWISKVKVIHWSWSKVTQIQHFQSSFHLKPLSRLKPNFIWSLHGMGERKIVQMVQVTLWLSCPYMVKTIKKIFFSRSIGPMTLKLSMWHQMHEHYKFIQIMTLDWPWPILGQGQIWSLMLLYGKRVKQWIFQKLL